jgi:hypothetical protein
MNAMRHFTKLSVLAVLSVAAASCGDVSTTGRAPVYLVIDRLEGTSTVSGQSSTVVLSDVSTNGSITNDFGEVTLSLAQKDVVQQNTIGPSTNNQVTVNRYHVAYKRADGRNTEGVDVPYAFDGAATATVGVVTSQKINFELVRHVAKAESPLVQLANKSVGTTVITTLAYVTFYGHDIVGNEIQATGTIQVDFGNFADSTK